jgi:hypothetical protein
MKNWTLSDDEFIERLRQAEKSRMKIALFLISIGLAMFAAGLYFGLTLYHLMMKAFSEQHDPTGADHTQFYFGVLMGLVIGKAAVLGVGSIVEGVRMVVTRRERRLLLVLWDALHTPLDESAETQQNDLG